MFGLLNNSDYARFMEDMFAYTTIINSPGHGTSGSYSPFRQNTPYRPQKNHVESLNLNRIMAMNDDELIQLAKNSKGTKQIQQYIQENNEVRQKFLTILTHPGKGILTRLATDSNGNFVIQKLITGDAIAADLIKAIEQIAPDLSLNRYGCRVIQKLIHIMPSDHIRQFLVPRFKGMELQLLTDQNGNHVILSIINHFQPEVYIDLIRNLSADSLRQIMENKYGCRVIQVALERVVTVCKEYQQERGVDKEKMPPAFDQQDKQRPPAFEMYCLLVRPILKYARSMAEHEFGNYMVQVIIRNDFLDQDRSYIIQEHLINNLLDLAQKKYSSHVLEAAFQHADEDCLKAMMLEILRGFSPNNEVKPALHYILFNEYGNYVFQRMLIVADQVRNGKRGGDPKWLYQLVDYAYGVPRQLYRYSSGKKILEMIHLILPTYPLLSILPNTPLANHHHRRQFNNSIESIGGGSPYASGSNNSPPQPLKNFNLRHQQQYDCHNSRGQSPASLIC